MNKSKRIRKATNEPGVHDKSKEKVVNPKFLTFTSIVLVIILVGALLFDQLYESTLMTVDGEKYHLQDLSYYFYTVEYQYDYYDQMFGGSGTYWDMSYDETTGATMRDVAKQEAMDAALYSEVLYNEATAEGYTLTGEENTTIETNVNNLLEKSLTEDLIEKNDFTKEYLTDIISKSTLVSRYRQDKIDALAIDDAKITAEISYDEYKQYDIEYLFASKKTTDAEGSSVDMSDAEKVTALKTLNRYYDTAKTTEDWTTLIPEDETLVSYATDNFIESDTTFDDALEATIMDMQNGAISEVFETDSGYYVIRMVNNDSSESYDTAVKDAITSAESEGFNELYTDILTNHEYKINTSALKSLSMGSITLIK